MPRLQVFALVTLFSALSLLTSKGYSVTRTLEPAATLLLSQANQARVTKGLKPVQFDPLLAQAAFYHALQMAAHDDISHGFDGEPDLSERGASARVHFSLITENVAEAQSPDIIHNLWMQSPDHRANLLDPDVNKVGIAVVQQHGATFAVEDFAATVDDLSLDQQEAKILQDLAGSRLQVLNGNDQTTLAARTTCSMPTGYAGAHQPWYVMRYTAAHLDKLPAQLQTRLSSGRYHQVAVGACASRMPGAFSGYSVAILLYP